MADIQHDDDYLGGARALLPEQFKGMPRIDALLQAYMGVFQEIEDAFYAVFVQRVLQNYEAVGDMLDKLGSLVGQSRNGSSDTEYAIFIQARIKANRSSGKAGDLLDILQLLFPTASPIVARYFVKALEYEVYGYDVNPYIAWRDFLAGAVVAGDSVRLFASPVAKEQTLVREWSGTPNTTTSSQRKGWTGVAGGGTGVFSMAYGNG